MQQLKTWIAAARLRTLPLSVSGILMGTAIAASLGFHDTTVTILALLTTVGFQITSNFANDYGDGVKGTDNDERVGPLRAIQSGALSPSSLKKGIILSVIINLGLVGVLLAVAFRESPVWLILLFLALGIVSIWAAIAYTVGSSAYGYRALGDLFVFLFFGLLSVLGTFFLYTKFLVLLALLPAIAIGALSTAVLNLNNMRDLKGDKKVGKITLAVLLGLKKARVYHAFLILLSFACMMTYFLVRGEDAEYFLCLLPYFLLFLHLRKIYQVRDPKDFDPELKKVALSTFALALFCYLAYNYFL